MNRTSPLNLPFRNETIEISTQCRNSNPGQFALGGVARTHSHITSKEGREKQHFACSMTYPSTRIVQLVSRSFLPSFLHT
mmetsp:Transcript_8901/g.17792  ORF Transcript_8901/g.17792 Transcript_8901/m.17792 type:complete len:80 (+) Transcript_8901:420-659(+)